MKIACLFSEYLLLLITSSGEILETSIYNGSMNKKLQMFVWKFEKKTICSKVQAIYFII